MPPPDQSGARKLPRKVDLSDIGSGRTRSKGASSSLFERLSGQYVEIRMERSNAHGKIDSVSPSLLDELGTSQAKFIILGLGPMQVPNYWRYFSRLDTF